MGKPKLGFADDVEVKEFDQKRKVKHLLHKDRGVYTEPIQDEEEDDDDEEEWGKDDE